MHTFFCSTLVTDFCLHSLSTGTEWPFTLRSRSALSALDLILFPSSTAASEPWSTNWRMRDSRRGMMLNSLGIRCKSTICGRSLQQIKYRLEPMPAFVDIGTNKTHWTLQRYWTHWRYNESQPPVDNHWNTVNYSSTNYTAKLYLVDSFYLGKLQIRESFKTWE